jgi:hypothetical protein
VRLGPGLNDSHKTAFKEAADRWSRAIIGDLPSYEVNGDTIDDIRIYASAANIDGKGGVLGKCGPDVVRPKRFRRYAYLPATAIMTLDEDDLKDVSQMKLRKLSIREMGSRARFGQMGVAQKRTLGRRHRF